MNVEVDFAARQIVGNRDDQEDFCAFSVIDADQPSLLGLLADGMGGYNAGAHASFTVANAFAQSFFVNSGTDREKLESSLNSANFSLKAEIVKNEEAYSGMGTTLIAVTISKAGINWVSVGDSLLYIWNSENGLQRLNADHSMAPEVDAIIREGNLSSEEMEALKRRRNKLRSAVVGSDINMVDLSDSPLQFRDDDYLLIASDGILSIELDDIDRLLDEGKDQPAHTIADSLLTAVAGKEKPNQDNTSVAIVKLESFFS